MTINSIADDLNKTLFKYNSNMPFFFSSLGERIYFPKGILSQSQEAKEKGEPKFNSTIGVAVSHTKVMSIPSLMKLLPSFDPDEVLSYSSSFGVMDLRHLWKDFVLKKNPSLNSKDISLPIVTNGITHGLSVACDLFIDKDDLVIIPDQRWKNYDLIASLIGGANFCCYPFFSKDNLFNLEAFEDIISKKFQSVRKLIIILNFPNNPTGYHISLKEADGIKNILKKYSQKGANFVLLIDDAYSDFVYEDNLLKESLFSHLSNLDEKIISLKLDGISKEFFAWGLRVAFITFNTLLKDGHKDFYEALERKTAGVIRGRCSNINSIGQSIVSKVIKEGKLEKEQKELKEVLEKRVLKIKKILKEEKYKEFWEAFPFNAGYFVCLKLKNDFSAENFRTHLLEKYKVGVVASDEHCIRIAFSSIDEENLESFFDLLYKAALDLFGK